METLRLLNTFGVQSLSEYNILDIGCGDGSFLRQLLQWGAKPKNLAGIDLRSGPVKLANLLNPNLDVICGSAVELPWSDETFDLVCLNTVFTSILDQEMKQQIVTEIDRILRSNGIILWYDYIFNNPMNPDVQGVKKREIHSLFPNYKIHLRKITLAPPIARRLPRPLLPILYPLLALIPFLRTHFIGIFLKQ